MATLAPRSNEALGLSKDGTVEFDRTQFGPPDIAASEIKYIKKIGGGCFGSVWLGECRGIRVAVKKLFKQDLSPKSLEDFKREVEFCSRLNHPNVLLFMGACTEPGSMAIVMELMDRGNLEQLLHHKGASLSLYRRIQMAKEVAAGMNWLHRSKPAIIHRDLKPSNLLVDKHGTIKVCDFGLSAIKPDTGKLKDKDNIPGTPLWMAPEVMLGRALDEKSDVYSYAIVLWEIVTQKVPFPDMKTFPVFKRKVCFENVRPPLDQKMPLSIQELLHLCWHRNPASRPGFEEVIQMLDDILVDCAVNCGDCRELWKTHYRGQDTVKFTTFLKAFLVMVDEPDLPELAKDSHDHHVRYECLKAILATRKVDDIMAPEDQVHIEQLGRVAAWFGPIKQEHSKKGTVTIIDRIVNVCKQGWFHGDISKVESETLLQQYKAGFFLIRLSTTNFGGYTISRVAPTPDESAKPPIIHHRIFYVPGVGFSMKFSMGAGNPAKEVRSGPTTSLRSFIKSIKADLFLETPVPGAKYKYIFNKVQAETLGYEEDMTEAF